MADYFTRFSVVVPLPDAAAQAYALDLARKAESIQLEEQVPEDFPASLKSVVETWTFETEPDHRDGKWALWLNSDSGGIDAACQFIQHLLQKFDPSGCVSFQWSEDCSQPRVDAFGGGAAVITAQEIKSMTTAEWISLDTPAPEGHA